MVVVLELANREVVGDDRPVETPLASQQLVEQPAIGAARHAVDLVVAVHHRTEPAGAHGSLERAQVHVAQLAFVEMGGRPVETALRSAVADEVLGGRDHAVGQVVTLQPTDVGEAHLRHELRVFAVRLLEPAPARIAAQIEHGREPVVGPDRPHLEPDGIGQLGVELGSERGCHADRLREHGCFARHQAGADLLVHDGGDTEAGVVAQMALELVSEPCRLGGGEAARAAHARHVADPVGEHGRRARRVEPAGGRQLEDPRAAELGDLLVDRHPRQQVGDTLGDRRRRIAIWGDVVCGHGSL